MTDSVLYSLAGFAISIMTCWQLTHKEKCGSRRVICGCVALLGLLTARHKAGSDMTVVATQYIAANGDEGEVCTTKIELRVALQHERPSGVDLTPDVKQLPDRCYSSEDHVLITVHLVAQEIWGT